jgi:hypothetical protein
LAKREALVDNATHRLIVAPVAVLLLIGSAGCGGGREANSSSGKLQADTGHYAALDALPDWSGTWANEQESTRQGASDCCAGDWSHIPFTPKYAEWRSKIVWGEANRPKGIARNNSASCMPAGVPGVMAHPILFEFLYTPKRVTIIYNDGEVRKIDTSGAAHPPVDEIESSFSGHSTGYWEQGALTIDTIAIDPRADLFMSNGMKVTGATQVVERMMLEGVDRLRVDTTITDPEVFTRPFAYTRHFRRVPGDFNPGCAANNVDDGYKVGNPEELR